MSDNGRVCFSGDVLSARSIRLLAITPLLCPHRFGTSPTRANSSRLLPRLRAHCQLGSDPCRFRDTPGIYHRQLTRSPLKTRNSLGTVPSLGPFLIRREKDYSNAHGINRGKLFNSCCIVAEETSGAGLLWSCGGFCLTALSSLRTFGPNRLRIFRLAVRAMFLLQDRFGF